MLHYAVLIALDHGCSLEQLYRRARYFDDHLLEWPTAHRPGVLYKGIYDAYPETPDNKGWPYQR